MDGKLEMVKSQLFVLCVLALTACGKSGASVGPVGPSSTHSKYVLESFETLDSRYGAVESKRIERGRATYYSDKLAGNAMASGLIYTPDAAVAAHRTLALGTVIRVVDESTGQSVIVKVLDRGPFGSSSLILDLSRAAAERLGIRLKGTAPVRLEVLEEPTR